MVAPFLNKKNPLLNKRAYDNLLTITVGDFLNEWYNNLKQLYDDIKNKFKNSDDFNIPNLVQTLTDIGGNDRQLVYIGLSIILATILLLAFGNLLK